MLGTCLSSGTLARDSVHLVPGVSHQRGSTSRVALYLELGDGLGGGRGGLRSHAQTAHLVHAAGPRSARSRALSPVSSRAVPVLVTTSSRGRDRARPSCCTTTSADGINCGSNCRKIRQRTAAHGHGGIRQAAWWFTSGHPRMLWRHGLRRGSKVVEHADANSRLFSDVVVTLIRIVTGTGTGTMTVISVAWIPALNCRPGH